jgi:hypothetical protein
MTTKRILFKTIHESNLTGSLYELEQLIETSKDVELFNSDIYFKRFNENDMIGLSIIGIDGELFDALSLSDLKIVKLGKEQYSFLKEFESKCKLDDDQVIVIQSDLEIFSIAQVQKIVD